MWKYDYSVVTDASAEQIWRVWADVEQWPQWDKGLVYSKIYGPFVDGSLIELKPVGGPKTDAKLTQCVQSKSFLCVSKLPLGTVLKSDHTIENVDNQTGKIRITNSIIISGPLSFLFGWLVGRKIEQQIPDAMQCLIERAKDL